MVNHIQKKLCHEEDDEGSWDWIRVGFGRVWIRIGFGLDSDLDSDGIRIGLGVFCFGKFVANWAWEWQDLVETCGNHHFKSEMDPPGQVSCFFSVIMFPGQCSAKSLKICAGWSSSLGLVCSSSIVW